MNTPVKVYEMCLKEEEAARMSYISDSTDENYNAWMLGIIRTDTVRKDIILAENPEPDFVDNNLPYYDDIWYVVIERNEDDRIYRNKAGVTRWLRVRGLRYKDDPYGEHGYPTQHVDIYDHHPEEGGVFVSSIPAPLWIQIIAKPK